MTIDTAVQSRFQVTDRPFLAPGRCNCCGSVDRPVVNWGANQDPEIGQPLRRRIYLCVNCVEEAGIAFGMMPRQLASDMADRIEELSMKLAEAEDIVSNIDDPTNDLNRRIIGGLQSAITHPRVMGQLSSVIEKAVRSGTSPDVANREAASDSLSGDSSSSIFDFSLDAAGPDSSGK